MAKSVCTLLLLCFAATFLAVPIVFASKKGTTDSDGPLTAFAQVHETRHRTTARGKVWASGSAKHGAYAISVVAGSDYDGAAGHYRNGLSTVSRSARDRVPEDEGNASAWISGHDRYGKAYFAGASE